MSDTAAAPKIQLFDPNDITVNAKLAARKGEPDKAKVKALAGNFQTRRSEGRPHQIQPGIVRIEDDVVELIAGRNRLEGMRLCNSKLKEGEEPFLFAAIAVPSSDTQALIDAVQENEWRTAANAVDRAEAMQKLVDLGKKRKDIATVFGCSDSLVGDLLPVAKLPKKIIDMYLAGKLDQQSLSDIARYADDETLQIDLLAAADQIRASRVEAVRLAEARAKEDATPSADKPKEKTGKNVPVSDAVKEKKRNSKGSTERITNKDVRAAAEGKNLKKKTAGGKETRNAKDLRVFLAATFGPEVTEAIPDAAVEIADKIIDWLDKDVGDRGLKDCIIRNVKEGKK